MSDERPSSLVTISAAQWLASKVNTEPEHVYNMLKEAEDWLEELKKKARDTIIKRMPVGAKSADFDSDDYTVNCSVKNGNIQPDAIHRLLTEVGIEPSLVVFKKPVAYESLPTARLTLDLLVKDGKITQAQHDKCFKPDSHVVTVKPKSARTITLLAHEER